MVGPGTPTFQITHSTFHSFLTSYLVSESVSVMPKSLLTVG